MFLRTANGGVTPDTSGMAARTLLKFAGPVSDSDFAPAGDYVAWVKDGELWRAKRDGSDPFKLAVGVEFARW
jgi:hypothetical protein